MSTAPAPGSDGEPAFIAEVLSDTFGERDFDRIRTRRVHRFLEICCGHLRAFAESIARGDKERARTSLDGFGFSFRYAIPSLRLTIGDDVTQRYVTDYETMLGSVIGCRSVTHRGRAGGHVISGIIPFHPRIAADSWALFVAQHGEELRRISIRQAERLERLMREVWPVPTTPDGGKRKAVRRRGRKRDASDETIAKAKGLWAEHPDWTRSQLAKALGVSRETLSRDPYKNELAGFRKEIDRVSARRREVVDPDEHMGDDEWSTMHVE